MRRGLINRIEISPSLFDPAWGDLAKFVYNPDFDLGVDADYFDFLHSGGDGHQEENAEQLPVPQTTSSAKRLKLSLSKSKSVRTLTDATNSNASGSRFGKPVSSPEREKAAQGVIPSNTESNTQWAVRTFNAWAHNRSFQSPSELVPEDLGL